MKNLVISLIGAAGVLSVFAEGDCPLDVAAGQTNVIAVSTVVTNSADIHGALIVDGTGGKVRVTPKLANDETVLLRLGAGAGDEARLEIKGDAKMLAGEEKNDPYDVHNSRKFIFGNLDIGSAEGGRGSIEVSGTGSDVYTGWNHLAYGLYVNRFRVLGVGQQPSDDTVVDVMRVNGNANTIVGTRSGWYNMSGHPVRILMNGGVIGGYQGPMFCGGKWIVESENGNDIKFWEWWANGRLLEPSAAGGYDYTNTGLEFRGDGNVILSGNDNNYTWTVTTNIVWNQTGNLIFSSAAGAKLLDDHALSKVQTGGRRVIFQHAKGFIDLNGHQESLDGFTTADITTKLTIKDSSNGTKGYLTLTPTGSVMTLADFGVYNLLTFDASCGADPVRLTSPTTIKLHDDAVTSLPPFPGCDLIVTNDYHWAGQRFSKTAWDAAYHLEERLHDFAPTYLDSVAIRESSAVIQRGALVTTNATFDAASSLSIATNSSLRLQAVSTRSEKFVRFRFKEARHRGFWIHIATLRLRDADNAEIFFGKSFTHNTTATVASELAEGQFMFNPGAVWTVGLACDMVGVKFNDHYNCDDVRFSSVDGWGGLCITNTIPRMADPSTWNVITLRLKDASKPVAGYLLRTNWTTEYFPFYWDVQVSETGADGTWVTIDTRDAYVPYRWSGRNAGTDELGGTYEGYSYFNDATATGLSRNQFRFNTNVDPTLVHLALNGAKVRVDCGGVLDASLTDGTATISNLEVDAGKGLGTFRHVTFAANGTLNVLKDGKMPSRLVIGGTFADCGTVDLSGWTVTVNGAAPEAQTSIEMEDGQIVVRSRKGLLMFVR